MALRNYVKPFVALAFAVAQTSIAAPTRAQDMSEDIKQVEALCPADGKIPAGEDDEHGGDDMRALCFVNKVAEMICSPSAERLAAIRQMNADQGKPEFLLDWLDPVTFPRGGKNNGIRFDRMMQAILEAGKNMPEAKRQANLNAWQTQAAKIITPGTDDLVDVTIRLVDALQSPSYAATCAMPLKPFLTSGSPGHSRQEAAATYGG